jgi:hypothetical protein
MFRSGLVLNIRSMSDLPLMERWLYRDQARQFISRVGAWQVRHHSYRAVPPPPDMYREVERFGYYNWRVSERWFHSIEDRANLAILNETFPPGYSEIVGQPGKGPRYQPKEWEGRAEGPHPPASFTIPARPTEDFLGRELTLEEKTILRWFIVFKYPKGVPEEEGEKWYLNVHAKEVMQQPGLTRFFSHRSVETDQGRLSLWNRVSEQWYENFDGWRKSVIDSPPKYTRPAWAKYDEYPFLEPYVDFVSSFILERPDYSMRDWAGYITGV